MLKIYFYTIPKSLNLLVALAILILLIKVFILNEIPAPFAGMNELGVIFEGVLGSVVASYIFYLIVVHTKEVIDASKIYPHVARWAKVIIDDCKSQLNAFAKASDIPMSLDSVTEEQLKKALSNVQPSGEAPLFLFGEGRNQANFVQYLVFHGERSKDFVSKIMTQLPFLDASFVSILMDIYDNPHFYSLEVFVGVKPSVANLSDLSGPFFKYCEACRNLEQYLRDHVVYAMVE